MQTLIIVGGLAAVAIYYIQNKLPAVDPIDTLGSLEIKKVKELGIATVGEKEKKDRTIYNPSTGKEEKITYETNKEYGQCATDANCQGDALFGASYRCISGRCTPLVQSESGILFNPIEIGAKNLCGRYYLMGHGQPCSKDSNCASSGLMCDVNDRSQCVFAGPTSRMTFCGSDGKCTGKTKPDWLNITWKPSDLPAKRVDELGVYDRRADTTKIASAISKDCAEVKALI